MPAGGLLSITTTNEVLAAGDELDGPTAGDFVRISVADTGVG
jgi:hypothetical protein